MILLEMPLFSHQRWLHDLFKDRNMSKLVGSKDMTLGMCSAGYFQATPLLSARGVVAVSG